MKLPFTEAQKCVSLLDSLDMYALKNFHVANKNKIYVDEDILQLRLDARIRWQNNPEIIEDFIATNKELSTTDIEIIKNWKNIKRENYILIKHYQEYSVFAQLDHDKMYGVLALTDDFTKILPIDPPLVVETSLLPYKGKIVWDGLVSICPIRFGREMNESFIEECKDRNRAGTIITSMSPFIDCNVEGYQVATEHFSEPRIKPAKKISRNAPCPCGSSKKYKKCCGNALPV